MLEQLGKHGGFDLTVTATGDLDVDTHHTIEDVGIVLGATFREALGDKVGVRRFASGLFPLDLREIVLHGKTVAAGPGANTPGEVNGTNGYLTVLPVTCGAITSVGNGMRDQSMGQVKPNRRHR